MVKEGDLETLNQLVKGLEESFEQFRKSYSKRDSEAFNKAKKNLIQMQRKISDLTSWQK